MEQLEERGRKRRARRNLERTLLMALKGAALLGVAIMAPNVPQALYKLGIVPLGTDTGVMTRMRKRMIKQGLITTNDKGLLRLTHQGKRQLDLIESREMLRKKPGRWDKRWRILIFDIPEYRKAIRNKMRRTLRSVGFFRLQDSVWIYPYDCEDFIVLLKADFKIGKDVLYMIVDELEGDARIRTHFGLN